MRAYGSPDPLHHEGVRSGGCEPPHDLQLDFGGQGGIRPHRRRIDPHLCRHALARRVATGLVAGAADRAEPADGARFSRVSVSSPAADGGIGASHVSAELRTLFHRLNNQLGILLAHAELLEAKAVDDVNRVRAAQVVTSALEAMGTVRELRQRTELPE